MSVAVNLVSKKKFKPSDFMPQKVESEEDRVKRLKSHWMKKVIPRINKGKE